MQDDYRDGSVDDLDGLLHLNAVRHRVLTVHAGVVAYLHGDEVFGCLLVNVD